MYRQWFMLLALTAAAATAHGELPEGATMLDPDIVWDPIGIESSAVSPDGKWFAYVSRGAIWRCSVISGPPTKLASVPDTITDFLARPEHHEARRKLENSTPRPGLRPLPELRGNFTPLFSLQWTPSQDGVVYTLGRRLQDNSPLAEYRVMHASLKSVVTEVAVMEKDFIVTPDSFTTFRVTPDRKYVVAACFGVPLIWDAAKNKPRATCFDYLLPSSTSGRFLGVEIDTRQLVLVDDDFRIVKRFDVTFDHRRRCDLVWSPDERFAVCRNHVERPSNKWEGSRVDLETGEVRQLGGGYVNDRFFFSSRGGDVIRIGVTKARGGESLDRKGELIELVPERNEVAQELFRCSRSIYPNGPPYQLYPPALCSSDCTLFAMSLPRKGYRGDFHYHLIDRQGRTWPFKPVDDPQFYAPYLPIAFANNDQTIIARKGSQLFSIPIETIQSITEATDE